MVIKQNLSLLNVAANKPTPPTKVAPTQVGRVYGVITTPNSPTKKMFEKAGGLSSVGTIFYLDYDKSIDVTGSYSDTFLDGCKKAIPFSQNIPYPLPGELVSLEDFPSAATQISNPLSQKYYTGIIHIYNNPQHHSQPAGSKYTFKTFKANEDVRNLLRFEGDNIIQGRNKNSIRFTSTVKDKANLNEWSNGPGEDGDPLIIISNGHNIDKNSKIHIEHINNEYSSIYFTSTQQIPLIPDRNDTLNRLTKPTKISDYYGPQIIINGDRIVINSKKDEVMIFASSNIELNTNNVINLNAKERVHINSNNISLGSTKSGELAEEPLILGLQLVDLLSELMGRLSSFSATVSTAISSPEGTALSSMNVAATTLNDFLIKKMDPEQLSKLLSKQNTTV